MTSPSPRRAHPFSPQHNANFTNHHQQQWPIKGTTNKACPRTCPSLMLCNQYLNKHPATVINSGTSHHLSMHHSTTVIMRKLMMEWKLKLPTAPSFASPAPTNSFLTTTQPMLGSVTIPPSKPPHLRWSIMWFQYVCRFWSSLCLCIQPKQQQQGDVGLLSSTQQDIWFSSIKTSIKFQWWPLNQFQGWNHHLFSVPMKFNPFYLSSTFSIAPVWVYPFPSGPRLYNTDIWQLSPASPTSEFKNIVPRRCKQTRDTCDWYLPMFDQLAFKPTSNNQRNTMLAYLLPMTRKWEI